MSLLNDLYITRKPLAGFAIIGIAWAAYFAQMPVIKEAIQVNDAQYGMLVFITAFGAVAAMLFSSRLQQLLGRYALVVPGLGVGIGFLGVSFASHWAMFVCMLLLASAGAGLIDVLANARISQIEAKTARALMNLNHAFYSFCYAGAAVLTGIARDLALPAQVVFATVFVVVCALCLLMYEGEDEARQNAQNAVTAAIPHRVVWIIGGIVLVAFLAESASEGWSALHIERSLGGSGAQGAMGPAILGLSMGFGRLFGYGVARIIPEMTLMCLACLLSASGIALAAGAHSVLMAYIGFGLGGLGMSVLAPLALGILGRLVPEEIRITAISRAAVLGYCAFFMGPSMMGVISEIYGLDRAFFFIAALLLGVVGLLIPLLPKKD